jgi:hypothetical protein
MKAVTITNIVPKTDIFFITVSFFVENPISVSYPLQCAGSTSGKNNRSPATSLWNQATAYAVIFSLSFSPPGLYYLVLKHFSGNRQISDEDILHQAPTK